MGCAHGKDSTRKASQQQQGSSNPCSTTSPVLLCSIESSESKRPPEIQIRGLDDDSSDGEASPSSPAHLPDFASFSEIQISDYMKRLFTLAAKINNGIIHADQLEELLYCSGFNLSSLVISKVLRAVDTHGDGTVLFEDYLHAVHITCQEPRQLHESAQCTVSNGLPNDDVTEDVALTRVPTAPKDVLSCNQLLGPPGSATPEKLQPAESTSEQMRPWQLLEVLQQCEQNGNDKVRHHHKLLVFDEQCDELKKDNEPKKNLVQAKLTFHGQSSRGMSAPSA